MCSRIVVIYTFYSPTCPLRQIIVKNHRVQESSSGGRNIERPMNTCTHGMVLYLYRLNHLHIINTNEDLSFYIATSPASFLLT